MTRFLLSTGQLQAKSTCEDCDAAAYHCHHLDYSDPFAVVWLCSPCHRRRHSLLRKQQRDALWTDDFVTSVHVARALRFTERTVRKLMAEKHLPGEQRGSEWRMHRDDFALLTKPQLEEVA